MTDDEVIDAQKYLFGPTPLERHELERALEVYGCGKDDWGSLFDFEKPMITHIALRLRVN